MLDLRKGKSKSNFGHDSKTEGATVTFTKTFKDENRWYVPRNG
jgi:hypothetical protein